MDIAAERPSACWQEALSRGGLSQRAVHEKSMLLARAGRALAEMGSGAELAAWWVPGRIEVLGKHTDYCGGRSLLAAVERGFVFLGAPRDDAKLRIHALDLGETREIDLAGPITPEMGHWSNYLATVARRLTRNFGQLRGADLVFGGDLPGAGGLSSSSAIIVGTFLVLSDLNQLETNDIYRHNILNNQDLANFLGTLENGSSFKELAGDTGVGTFGGSEDHTAILDCRRVKLSMYHYAPVTFEKEISLAPNYTFAVASSGVVAEKTGAAREKYNRAARLASEAVKLWNQSTGRDDPHFAGILTWGDAVHTRKLLRQILEHHPHPEFSPVEMLTRFDHFLYEDQLVRFAAQTLDEGGLLTFGYLVDHSQHGAENMLHNQVPQTSFLAHQARELGALATTAFGAGFGGSVWALVEAAAAEKFLADWQQRYQHGFPENAPAAHFFTTTPAPAAFKLA